MSAFTRGYLHRDVTHDIVFEFIKNSFDSEATEAHNVSMGEVSAKIRFKFDKEDRELSFWSAQQDPEDSDFAFFDGDRNINIVTLGIRANSVFIITEILKNFGGYFQENDCSDWPPQVVDGINEVNHVSYSSERDSIINILDMSLSQPMKYQIAYQILKHREKIKNLL